MWLVLGVAKMKAAFEEVPQNTTWLFSAPPPFIIFKFYTF